MLKLNVQLMNSLPQIMEERVMDFTDRVWGKGRKHMWNQNKDHEWKRLTCYDLARISNAYHIPLGMFLCEDIHIFTHRSQLELPGTWEDVTFSPDAIINDYRSGSNARFMLKQYADAMHTTSSCLFRWFTTEGNCTMTVMQYLQMTYELDLPLDYCFTDHNMSMPSHLKLNTAVGTERTLKELQEMRELIRSQQQQIRQLKEDNKLLKTQGMVCEDEAGTGEYNVRMRPWRWNQHLWDNLYIVVGKSKREVERLTGVKSSVDCPTLLQLVTTCNRLKISARYFFMRSIMEPRLKEGETYVMHDFREVKFDGERLNKIFGVGNILGKKRTDILDIIDTNDMMVRRWCKTDSTLDVKQMVEMCNALDLTPWMCIEDTNFGHNPMTLTEMLIEENLMLKMKQ